MLNPAYRPRPDDPDARRLGPLHIRAATSEAATHDILTALQARRQLRVAFANTNLLYHAIRDPHLARSLSSFTLLNDGVGVALLARLACGRGFAENLNGTDFTPRLLAAAPAGARTFLIGARSAVAEAAAAEIARRWPQLSICGVRDGFGRSDAAIDELQRLKPDLILVAMGNPRQELWIARAGAAYPNAVYIGVGALFDFLSGAAPRAPETWRRLRLEWAFRLLREPRRLWRRYTVEAAIACANVLLTAALRRPL